MARDVNFDDFFDPHVQSGVPLPPVIVRFLDMPLDWISRYCAFMDCTVRLASLHTQNVLTYDIEICLPDGRWRLRMPDAAFGIVAASVTAGTIA